MQEVGKRPEFREKMREARKKSSGMKGHSFPAHNRIGCYKICPKTGEVILRYKSFHEAHLDGFPKVECCESRNNGSKYYRGYFWAKEGELDKFDLEEEQNKMLFRKFKLDDGVKRKQRPQDTPILIFTKNGNQKIVENTAELKKFLGLTGRREEIWDNIKKNKEVKEGYNCQFI
jgi:hypothetical protein